MINQVQETQVSDFQSFLIVSIVALFTVSSSCKKQSDGIPVQEKLLTASTWIPRYVDTSANNAPPGIGSRKFILSNCASKESLLFKLNHEVEKDSVCNIEFAKAHSGTWQMLLNDPDVGSVIFFTTDDPSVIFSHYVTQLDLDTLKFIQILSINSVDIAVETTFSH